MKQQHADYHVVPYPKHRRAEAVLYRSVQRTPMIHGLLEVDVTRARTHLRDHKANTGESLSFTAFLIACLAKAVDEHKAVQASRKGSKHLILFDEVDVYIPIERDVARHSQIIGYTIRAANRKTFPEIHHEIRAAQVQDVAKASVRYQVFQFLPLVVFSFIWRLKDLIESGYGLFDSTVESEQAITSETSWTHLGDVFGGFYGHTIS